VSSSYPAWFLCSFNPAEGIKGKIKTGGEGKSFRNGLVIFQFAVSILLMISTVIVFQQLNHVSEKDLGFDKENLLVLEHIEGLPNGEAIRDQALRMPGVVSASHCSSLPPLIFGGDKFTAEGMNSSFSLNYTTADENYIPTLDLEMKFGGNFDAESAGESEKVILNESAIRRIGWPLDASVIGRNLKYPNFDDSSFEVIGVVSDFNYWSLETSIEPMAIFHITNHKVNAGDRQFLALRITPQNTQTWETTLAAFASLWRKHAGDSPFEYSFVDEVFAKTFQTHEQFGNVITVLAVLALMIASLGLLGMIVYALEQRMKEIAIRKISGASVKSIFILISRSYTKLIFIAFVAAAPLSYWLMQQWLQDFAYRISPPIGVFLLIGAVTLFVAILITAYHSVKAARMNPVNILRDE
jgi:putative ABC transport system permease protein